MELPEKRNIMGIYGNVWFHSFVLQKGEVLPCHSHKHGHVTLIGHGSVIALIDDKPAGEFVKGEAVPVAAHTMHGYQALEDNTTLFCTFAVRDEDQDLVSWDDAIRIPAAEKHDKPSIEKRLIGAKPWQVNNNKNQ